VDPGPALHQAPYVYIFSASIVSVRGPPWLHSSSFLYLNAEPDFVFDPDPDPASNMMQIHADLDLQHFILSYFLLN
jgi:hypothetical protein